jgi:hypothetical protein
MFIQSSIIAKVSYGIMFYAHNLNEDQILSIDRTFTQSLRLTTDLPFDCNREMLLAEFGLPTFKSLRAIQTLRYVQKFHRKTVCEPALRQFHREIIGRHKKKLSLEHTPLHRRPIQYIADEYIKQSGYDPFNAPPIESKHALSLSLRTLNTSNATFTRIKSIPQTSMFLRTDDPPTAATRINLRSGHRLKSWRFLARKEQDNLCRLCNSVNETPTHVIEDCHAYDRERNAATNALAGTRQRPPFTADNILGSDTATTAAHRVCLSLSTPLLTAIYHRHCI